MGKPSGKKKHHDGGKSGDSAVKRSTKAFDEDTTVFINMSQELKEKGSKLFQKRDYEGAILKYEKALKLLPRNHTDIIYLRCNIATCYMKMSPGEYHNAINECNLALEVSPKYSKALLKRAKCYEALNKLELAYRDTNMVLSLQPSNLKALEISKQLQKGLEKKGLRAEEIGLASEYMGPDSPQFKIAKVKSRKKKSRKTDDKGSMTEDKAVVEESCNAKEEAPRTAKLVFGEDIRSAQLPGRCSILQLREIVRNRFPGSKAMLIKYKDEEGDLVTITTTEELRWAEASADPQGSVRLYLAEVDPEQEPSFFKESNNGVEVAESEMNQKTVSENGSTRLGGENGSVYVDDWIIEFARMFKNHVGFDSDTCLDLHELGMRLYSEAMEDAMTSEEAQDLFEIAEGKFQEMAALALFNWGNVHISRARKRVFLMEDASKETILLQVQSAYEWARGEYEKASERYKEAIKIKPNFYEGLLALGLQQFEQAKLTWYFAVGSKVDLDTWPYEGMLSLFDHAEDNIAKGSEIWEVQEMQRLDELAKPDKEKQLLKKMGMDELYKDVSTDEAAEQAANMRSQINILWGTLLYERSVIEFKLGLDFWEDCLEAAIEKFELAGASRIDTAVMRKNHCSNVTAQEGLVFKIDEIVQAWNEMYDAKRWLIGAPSFRLEPLFRRRVPKLHQILENV
ncbi:protein PHOX1-like [Magnolia sinica]|uniref:protein PHOX1-like n=1 Tax=Magnolia sinica TaxID=86752 RepID=UPI00265A0429|nr:protein PHOX1-like [Magnolia sinica]XP_058087138.1 protein PHOX1-like [Magnolia sinica]XP_058087139.1 protein PHOX1-like [Magnolia sinica]